MAGKTSAISKPMIAKTTSISINVKGATGSPRQGYSLHRTLRSTKRRGVFIARTTQLQVYEVHLPLSTVPGVAGWTIAAYSARVGVAWRGE